MFRFTDLLLARPKRTPSRYVAIGLIGFAVSGCGQSGPKLADVQGKVTLDGNPLPDVMLEFQPTGGKGSPSIGYTDKNGEFRLRFSRDRWGAVPGQHLVKIDHDYDPGSDQKPPAFKIPPKFNASSDLRRDLKPGANEFNFELSSKEMLARKSPPRSK
jgi:hypothetical protein